MATQAELPPATRFVEYGLETKLEASRTAFLVFKRLLHKRRNGDSSIDSRIKHQAAIVLENLRPLQTEAANIREAATARRLRAWGIGGAMATLSPWVSPLIADTLFPDTASRLGVHHSHQMPHSLLHGLSIARSKCRLVFTTAMISFAVFLVLWNEFVVRNSRKLSTKLCTLYAHVESQKDTPSDVVGDALESWWWTVLQWAR